MGTHAHQACVHGATRGESDGCATCRGGLCAGHGCVKDADKTCIESEKKTTACENRAQDFLGGKDAFPCAGEARDADACA